MDEPRRQDVSPAREASDLTLRDMDPEGSTAIEQILINSGYRACDVRGEQLELANDAHVAELAIDMAHAVGATSSMERMLAHQMALAHRSAFLLGRQLERAAASAGSVDGANLRAVRLATAMSRTMAAYQQGMLTLQRVRSAGQQTTVVQHVQVNEGGQAVVAGEIGTGGARTADGDASKNER
jgi:hypothetical protein